MNATLKRDTGEILKDIEYCRGNGMKIFYLDECNFTKKAFKGMEYSRKNTNICVDQNRIYTGYRSVIAVISEGAGVEAIHVQSKAIKQDDFIQFLFWLHWINAK